MPRLPIFIILSIFFVYISRKSLCQPRSHGFYRFFAFEAIASIVLLNYFHWFLDPFSPRQLVSWTFLIISICLVVYGSYLLRVLGKPDRSRADETLFAFERTSSLVTTGLYKYIRHPLYSSLLFLAWGAFFKDLSWLGFCLVFSASVFLFVAAKREESECLQYFGHAYRLYMKKTKGFVPFLF
jgi:protein-S-isoprenylcysteine O-methyltransferase Ste14